MVNQKLKDYIESNIIPMYDKFDKGHDRTHVTNVIKIGMGIAADPILKDHDINEDMVYTVCAYHDVGLKVNRENHGFESMKILIFDNFIDKYFSKSEIVIMAQAIEDHRSKWIGKRRNVYGKIVADADRESALDPIRGVERLWGYRVSHFPDTTDREKFEDIMKHVKELYKPGGKFYKTELNIPLQIEEMKYTAKIMTDPNEVQKILRQLGLITKPIY